LTAISVVTWVVIALTGCSTGGRADLGDESSGNLIAAIAGEPDQLDPQRPAHPSRWRYLRTPDTLAEPDPNLEMRPARGVVT
jgi:peptide/nickel transport system substrate-binding protein